MHANGRKESPLSDAERTRRQEQSRRDLLSRNDIEREYKGITRRWLELAALSGEGPPMVRLSRRMIRYRRGIFEDWLDARTVSSTSDEIEAA